MRCTKWEIEKKPESPVPPATNGEAANRTDGGRGAASRQRRPGRDATRRRNREVPGFTVESSVTAQEIEKKYASYTRTAQYGPVAVGYRTVRSGTIYARSILRYIREAFGAPVWFVFRSSRLPFGLTRLNEKQIQKSSRFSAVYLVTSVIVRYVRVSFTRLSIRVPERERRAFTFYREVSIVPHASRICGRVSRRIE